MLVGIYHTAIDASNRIKLPSNFLDHDSFRQAGLIIVIFPKYPAHLEVYTEPGWDQAKHQAKADGGLPLIETDVDSKAEPADPQGRIRLSNLARHAILHNETKLVAVGIFDHIEIYTEVLWDKMQEETQNRPSLMDILASDNL